MSEPSSPHEREVLSGLDRAEQLARERVSLGPVRCRSMLLSLVMHAT